MSDDFPTLGLPMIAILGMCVDKVSWISLYSVSSEELSVERVHDLCHEICDDVLKAAYKQIVSEIWHKKHPNNHHPYPVINPDTGEMAYAYYDELSGWQFDRDYKRSIKMLWLDIEKILPNECNNA